MLSKDWAATLMTELLTNLLIPAKWLENRADHRRSIIAHGFPVNDVGMSKRTSARALDQSHELVLSRAEEGQSKPQGTYVYILTVGHVDEALICLTRETSCVGLTNTQTDSERRRICSPTVSIGDVDP
jgi:hypothetical protein